MSVNNLFVSVALWDEIISELKRRGQGCRESGGFLLGDKLTGEITGVVYYDDLDPNALHMGGIALDNSAYPVLWQHCRANKVRVLADVHTHPGSWTRQSPIDKANPMIPNSGHIALIIPRYAQRKNQKLRGVGIFEYLGDYKWRSRGGKGRFNIIVS